MREMQLHDQEYGVEGPLCDCGLPVERSSLPRGWSVHLSQDDETIGEVSSPCEPVWAQELCRSKYVLRE